MTHEPDSDDLVTLVCSGSNGSDADEKPADADADEIIISAAEIGSWDLPSVFAHEVIKIEVNSHRLIEESSYFRGLLSGSFSESRLRSVSIHWNVESFVSLLMVVFGCRVEISLDNFIPLNEAALFFGVDSLLFECRLWLEEVTAFRGTQSPQLCLDDLIRIWKHGLEHALYKLFARNFMWLLSFNSYIDVPDKLFYSCIEHPDLTVDSEKHLCEAILVWLNAKTAKSEGWISSDLCDKIRTNLLPLWYAAGKRRCRFLSKFAVEATGTILSLARHPFMNSTDIFRRNNSSQLRIRLTKYTQRVDVSSCPQITEGLFLLSVLPSCCTDSTLRKIMKKASINYENNGVNSFQISQAVGQKLNFESVQELDISNCPSLSLESAIDCFCKLFPSLRTLRAVYYLSFKTRELCQLVQKMPLLANIDLTLDINPVIHAPVSITASSSVLIPERSTTSFNRYNYAASLSYTSKPLVASIIRLTLEGRTDVTDSDLLLISEFCRSLSYVNMKGCTSVTDHGMSVMILKCKMLQSILACDTSFGNGSVRAFSSAISTETELSEKNSQLMAYKLLTLHVGGCHGITGKILSELMSGAYHLKSLCLREIQHVDDALYKFSGVSLEMLDVSDTKISSAALSHIIRRNPDLKSLKTRGCKHLLRQETETKDKKSCNPSYTPEELYSELGKSCKLEEIELGWGFSLFSLEALKPAMRTLRALLVGLGGSLGPSGLKLLPAICPLLETLVLYFQVISDAVTDIINTLPHLQSLALCYCIGDISSLSFKFRMPNLRNLKLERVTPWMTNEELATLAENCANLVKLSLIGCTLLDSEAQAIISSGWPGLTSLHLEECGEITVNGVRSLLDCHALEDLIIRHTGPGIPKNFITYAASKLPMLRKISLDICDAREGDFDIPSFGDRCFLSIVKIARCTLRKNTLDLHNVEAHRTPVHKETLVMVWNSEKLDTTVVKERV